MRWGYGKINAKKGLEYIQDHVTGIVDVEHGTLNMYHPADAGWYTLDGRRLSGKPSQKGVYINKGVKIRE